MYDPNMGKYSYEQNPSGSSNQYNQPSVKQYDYGFSNGNMQPVSPKEKKHHGWVIFFTVFLCVTLSFFAGIGGAYFGFHYLDSKTSNWIYPAPDQNNLYKDNPNEYLNKSEAEGSIYGSAGEEVFEISQVVRKVQDSVVVIDTDTGSGSGVIISEDGYILTCNHVVESARQVVITLNSGSQYSAALVGSDATSDLAVLKIEPQETLCYVEQGSSADLVVGEVVVAIGNPLGSLGGSVTDGIISATERKISMSDGTVMTLLQTNAAINSGNSGGGLFNLNGQLIGIVNAKYASAGVEGLAFAIPIDSAYLVQLDLIQYGYVRGVIDDGIQTLDVTEADLLWNPFYYSRFGITSAGVYVHSSTYSEELKNADRIISVNGTTVNSTAEYNKAIENLKVGDTLTIVASRAGNQFTVTLTLQEYIPDAIKDQLN